MVTTRRSTFADRRLRHELLRFGRDKRRLLATSSLAGLAACVLPLVVGSPGYVTGAIHAFMVTALFTVFAFGFLLDGDGGLLLAGTYGEAYTRDQIAAAVRRGDAWSAVHNIEVGVPDVDHVVFTPSGVVAVETKWRFGRVDELWLSGAVVQAREVARKARLVLLSQDIGYRTEVRPVLVVWGGGRRGLPDIQVRGGVEVVRGDALGEWFRRCSYGTLPRDEAAAVYQRLADFAESRASSAV